MGPRACRCRAGLYKQLAEVKNLVAEFREDPQRNTALRGPIVENLRAAGLQKDCPFRPASGAVASNGHARGANKTDQDDLTAEAAMEVPVKEFAEYAGRLYAYLQACCSLVCPVLQLGIPAGVCSRGPCLAWHQPPGLHARCTPASHQ